MSRIEELPAEELAVLRLALRSDRPFGELAGVLGIDEAEMRRRAHAALDGLGPDQAGDLDPARRTEIGDWLLGQQTAEERAATERFLATSGPGRGWARVVADQLRGLGAQELPDIPTANGAAAVSPAGEVAAATAPVATAPTAPPPDDGAGDGAAPAFGAPRSSRLGGALLLGGLAVVALAVVLFFVLRGGGGDSKTTNSSTPAASTAATQPKAQVEAQANLVPPSNRKSLKALGVVLVQRAQGQDQIVAAVQGLPKPKKGGYGIWLYSGPGKAQWLGFFASQDQQGRLLARGQLKASIADFREILVTREAKGNPTRPGPIFLRGPVQLAGSGKGG